jgi:uncharacterized DUF497 family protein
MGCYTPGVDFVWDEQKNESNIRKHGLDFSDAWRIFIGPVLVARDDREDYGEERWIGIGLLDARAVVIVFSERDDGSIRVISLRRTLRYERERFEEYLEDRLAEDR